MWEVGPTGCAFDVYDVATQAMTSNYFTVDDGRGEYFSIPFRYVWPAELDLMARLAGLRLQAALGRVEPGAVHRREPPARLGLGEARQLVR